MVKVPVYVARPVLPNMLRNTLHNNAAGAVAHLAITMTRGGFWATWKPPCLHAWFPTKCGDKLTLLLTTSVLVPVCILYTVLAVSQYNYTSHLKVPLTDTHMLYP